MKQKEVTFWSTIIVSFVLLVHNGLEPVFILAYSFIPLLIWHFYAKKSLLPLAFYLLIFGALGRYFRYFRQGYSSDALLATRDFIGILLSGQNPYDEVIFTAKGLTPFIYLPFSLFWYLPAQIFSVDLRFFEMVVSSLVPVMLFLTIFLTSSRQALPLLSVVSLTPFLLDLSSDGSNDNSAVFILLLSVVLLVYSIRKKSKKSAVLSAVILGLALTFKHYVFFYFLFLVPFLWQRKNLLPLSGKKYLFYSLAIAVLLMAPFILSAPSGFFQSTSYIEGRPGHSLWGWNIWSAISEFVSIPDSQIQLIRMAVTLLTASGLLFFFKIDKFHKVIISASLTLLVYLVFSKWTSYAYFTFLIPLTSLAVINEED